jgi:hypothetical protein
VASRRGGTVAATGLSLYDYRLEVIPPHSTLRLTVHNPPCRYQADAFYGRLIESFAGGARYNERRLDDTDGVRTANCVHCTWHPRPRRAEPAWVPNDAGSGVFARRSLNRNNGRERPVIPLERRLW